MSRRISPVCRTERDGLIHSGTSGTAPPSGIASRNLPRSEHPALNNTMTVYITVQLLFWDTRVVREAGILRGIELASSSSSGRIAVANLDLKRPALIQYTGPMPIPSGRRCVERAAHTTECRVLMPLTMIASN